MKVEFRHFADVLYAVITFQRGSSVGAQIFSCLPPLPDQEIVEVFQLLFVHNALLSDLGLFSSIDRVESMRDLSPVLHSAITRDYSLMSRYMLRHSIQTVDATDWLFTC